MMDGFTATVFSWSLEDIFNEDLYTNKVEKIPESFESVDQYHGSYLYPLLEETRAQVHSSMDTIYSAPFAEVVEFEKKSEGQYKIKVDSWQNRLSDGGKEPYKTLPWDLFVLANAKPESVSDLELARRSWCFVSVTHLSQFVSNVSKNDGDEDEDEDEDENAEDICLRFEVMSSKEFEVDESTSLFVVFLVNLIPNARIWKALHMSRNLDIIEQVLRFDSVGRENDYSEKNKAIMDKGLDESGLNKSQTGAVLACLGMLQHRAKSAVELIWGPPGTGKTKTIATLLLILLRRNCRALICAPTNVAITEVASHILKMVTETESSALFCSLGEILLFGNKERLKLKKRLKPEVGSDIEEIYLDHRIQRLAKCLEPQTGWMHCFAAMRSLLEDCVGDYNNESNKEREQNKDCEMNDECRSEPKVSEHQTFLEYFRDRFVSTALPLRHCISVFCTHLTKRCISTHILEKMASLISLVDSFELLLLQSNIMSEAMEKLFSCSVIEDVSESYVHDSIPLFMKRRECLLALRSLQYSLRKVLQLPDFSSEHAIMELCFQSASLIFCTASSSFKLHRMKMKPFSIVVIDEAAQMKECESTIPLQLPGVKHVALFGDECQLPAMVQSNVSREAGFARSLFERLSSVGHPKHLLFMQYRMHPSISSFPNSSFYDNRIEDSPNVIEKSYEKHYLPGAMFGPYSFINVNDGREEKQEDGHSRRNMVEVAIVLKLLQNLYKEWISSKQKISVGVVSPYAAQVAAIHVKLRHKYEKLDGFKVKVKTIDGFQGGEEDIIIMSTVRTNSHQSLQFISNPQRVNVALTRARHCLWILGNERTLRNDGSVWESLVLDAKRRQCFFNADQDKDLAKSIVDAKKELDQFDDLLNPDSILFKNARWKVVFSENFCKSFKKLKSTRLKKSALNLLLRLSSGWRPKHNTGTSCSSSSILKKYKVEGLYIVCTTDIAKDLLEKENSKDLRYIQILKVWDILPLEYIPKLGSRLETILKRYTDDFINLCKEKYFEGNLEVPQSWPVSMELSKFKDPSVTETQRDFVGDTSDVSSYVEHSQVSESLLLMKFYALSSGVVNYMLSDREGRELDLPFEVTDQERDIILHHRSSFIVGRSGTGKTTVLTMKLFQKERWHHLAVQGCYDTENNNVPQSSATTDGKVLRQLFVTVSPKLCFAIKQHVLHLKSFSCGGSDSTERRLIDMVDIDEEESQFKDIQDSFRNIPLSSYPLVITFHKFLMMLDGTLSNSYFARFRDAPFSHGQSRNSRTVAFRAFIRAKEVSYERFSSSYWPHFNTQLTKNLDVSRVFTEIISHIKGGLGAIEACNGRLSREDYVQLSDGQASTLSKQKREGIYNIFQVYEKMKMGYGEFDLADFVIDLQRRLKHEKYEGDQMDFIYIDEVQDLTMSQIALFKHVCNNVDEGFVFSGDTAQTIARGIDFRFEDIRHLFYKKFVQESRSNKHGKRKEKGKISEIYHLTENFRTHAGILKLAQSIINLLYRFFPLSIDVLKPESSLVYGEAPVVLESGENENAIIKIFGNSGNIVGFGAEQVILVRDDTTRKEISNVVRKRALVLTIVECKGLEFQDVLLYNFFGSSPLKNQWRVIYGYMMEQDLLDSTLPRQFPLFNEAKHNILCSELKQLYVAVTRTRQRLWICETVQEISKPMFDYWKKKCLVQVWQLDDSIAQTMQVASSTEEWKSRGIKLYRENNYEMAAMCFERAGDTYWEQRSKASGLQAIADRMRMSNPGEANSSLREAAEIFIAIGKADSAARCFSDSGEYERAARIYLEKCGDSELERAAECFTLAGCYEDAAHVYAKGNFFSECLSVCVKGKLFELGLQYINNWKRTAAEDSALTRRGEGIHKLVQEFLESCALHYHKKKDDRSMMKFVKAFHSILLMRNFLKSLGSLDELLVLEEEFGNYLEAAEIAQLKGEFLLESDLLGKAGEFKEASMHVLSYVLASSLWSSGSKGWPMKKFAQQEVLLRKAKEVAKNEAYDFYELVCTEVEILLHGQDRLSLLKNQMKASQRHGSIRGEVLSARKILDAHLSSRTDMYLWEGELNGDLIQHSEDMISKNQVSIESLVYFWNFWKEKIILMIESLGCLKTQEVNQNGIYQKFCLNYLGVWRLSNRVNPVYVLLFSDAEWVRDVDTSYFRRHGKLVSIDVHQLVLAAQNYWCSELLSVGIEVLEKLDELYKFAIGSSDSAFFQSKALTFIYDVAIYLLNSKCLKRMYQDSKTLKKFVTSSTENFVAYMFPLDRRKSMRENMISLRRTDASKNVLHQVIDEYISLKNELSSAQIGRIAMIILGSGKLNFKLCNKLVTKLECNQPWKDFIKNLCASTGPGNTGQKPREVTVLWRFFEALVETYNVNWRVVDDYITPGCFLYLLERLLIWANCFQGYVITTSSCFIDWLMYQDEDTSLSSIVADVRSSIEGNEGILRFIITVVSECLCDRENLIDWIKKSNADWKSCYSLLVPRLVVLLCLLYVNFGMCLDILSDLLGRSYITEQLPWEFYDTLKRRRKHNSLDINVEVLAVVLKKFDNPLVIASFGFDCSSLFCSDAIFVDMKADQCKDDIVRKMFPKPHVIQVALGQIGSVETEAQALPKKIETEAQGSKCNVM